MNKLMTPTVSNVLRIAVPLMISMLSYTLMTFVDRLILAKYSTTAMNAAAAAGMMAAIFTYGTLSITGISEVLVGQYNGAKEYKKIAVPVWQMIYFSCLLALFFIPLGLFAGPYLLAGEFQAEGTIYYRWIMSGGFIVSMSGALSGFFIGRGKPYLVTLSAIVGNVLNCFLDIIFVFGYKDIIPSMGVEGAAIATLIGESTSVLILFIAFLKPKNNLQFNTHKLGFDWSIFKTCFRIGAPSSIGHMLEIAAWAAFFPIVAIKGTIYATVLSIGQTVFILFVFLMDALSKSTTAISSNLIGEKRMSLIPQLLISSTLIHFGIVMLLFFPLVPYSEHIVQLFCEDSSVLETSTLMIYAQEALFWVWVYFLFDGMTWIFAGIFTSAGDTVFTMIANAFCSWILAVLPLYVLMNQYDVSPAISWQLTASYGFVNVIIFFLRYRSKKWVKFKVTDPESF